MELHALALISTYIFTMDFVSRIPKAKQAENLISESKTRILDPEQLAHRTDSRHRL